MNPLPFVSKKPSVRLNDAARNIVARHIASHPELDVSGAIRALLKIADDPAFKKAYRKALRAAISDLETKLLELGDE